MICPTVWIYSYSWYSFLLALFHQTLAASDRRLISTRSSLHLFALDHRRHDSLWFLRFFFLLRSFFSPRLLRSLRWFLSLFLSWLLGKTLLPDFFSILFLNWRLLNYFRSAFILKFLRKVFLLNTRSFFLLDRIFTFRNGWFCLINWWSSFLNGRFSLSDGRL